MYVTKHEYKFVHNRPDSCSKTIRPLETAIVVSNSSIVDLHIFINKIGIDWHKTEYTHSVYATVLLLFALKIIEKAILNTVPSYN